MRFCTLQNAICKNADVAYLRETIKNIIWISSAVRSQVPAAGHPSPKYLSTCSEIMILQSSP